MPTLFDMLQKKMNEPIQAPAQGLGSTDQAAGLLRTKLTGQDLGQASGSEPQRSTIGEQAAVQQTQQALGQIQQQSQITQEQQAQQSADQVQQDILNRQQEQNTRQIKQEQFANQANSLLQEYTRGKKKIQTAEDIQKMEQAAALIRFSSKKYTEELELAGRNKRLDEDFAFKQAYYDQEFADRKEYLQNKIDWDKIMAADDLAYNEELAKISLDDAIASSNIAIDAANTQAMWQGASTLVQGGVQGVGAYQTYQGKLASQARQANADIFNYRKEGVSDADMLKLGYTQEQLNSAPGKK